MSAEKAASEIAAAAAIACAKTPQVALVAKHLPDDLKQMVSLIYKLGYADGIRYGLKFMDSNAP